VATGNDAGVATGNDAGVATGNDAGVEVATGNDAGVATGNEFPASQPTHGVGCISVSKNWKMEEPFSLNAKTIFLCFYSNVRTTWKKR
jgi:hypothetical protein